MGLSGVGAETIIGQLAITLKQIGLLQFRLVLQPTGPVYRRPIIAIMLLLKLMEHYGLGDTTLSETQGMATLQIGLLLYRLVP
jgi:hypothetical protein